MITKYLVFDFGGTLAEYKNLPNAWCDYYPQAFHFLETKVNKSFSQKEIQKATKILSRYNARLYPRENEISHELIFTEINHILQIDASSKDSAKEFYGFFQKKLEVFEETQKALSKLKEMGYRIGVLSDLPTAMPHETFLEDLGKIGFNFDIVHSSQSIGWRKPCTQGLEEIAKAFNCMPSELTYIGDEAKDMEMINKLNGVSVLINRSGVAKNYGQQNEISNLIELLNLIKPNE